MIFMLFLAFVLDSFAGDIDRNNSQTTLGSQYRDMETLFEDERPVEQNRQQSQRRSQQRESNSFRASDVSLSLPEYEVEKEQFALLKTSMGKIKIRLFTGIAPDNVSNFINLAKGDREFVDVSTGRRVRRPFFDGMIFHRVVSDFLIQTGCPFGTGRGNPGYTLPDEFPPLLKFDRPGLVGLAPARTTNGAIQPNTNGSQFFITLSSRPELNGKITIIGEVTEGMDVVRKIGSVETGPTERPLRRIFLNTIEIIEEGDVLRGLASEGDAE